MGDFGDFAERDRLLLERYLAGPVEAPDHSRRRTELAYLVAWP